jgi:exopolysaccharide biosynthesis polyprenyl glycosylphosphotransferase
MQSDRFTGSAHGRNSIVTHLLKLVYVLGILALQQGSFLLSFYLVYSERTKESSFEAYVLSIPLIIIISLVVVDFYGMTHFYRKTSIDMMTSCFKLTALVTLSITFFAFFFQYFEYPRYVIALSSILMFIFLTIWSVLFLYLSHLIYPKGRMLIIASDEVDANKLYAKARHESRKLRINYLGWVPDQDMGKIRSKIREATEVLVSMNVSDDVKTQIILFCAEKKKTVYIVPQFYELAYARFRIVQFYDTPTFMIDSMGLTFQQRLFKRIFDVAFSILAIIITLPVQLLIILAIKLDSPGPAIYSQERNTIGSRIYNVYKFRTMVKDAEERFGAYQANEADPRLTRVGKILRSMHLDELPQFVNVLIGDMSVVGPRSDRPITINEFEQRIPGYNQRLKVKSGITGLAQVMGKYNTDPEDKLRFDMIYIKNYSMLLDFKIILMSLGAFIPKNRNSKVKTTSDYVVTGEALSDSRDGQKLVKKEDPDIS